MLRSAATRLRVVVQPTSRRYFARKARGGSPKSVASATSAASPPPPAEAAGAAAVPPPPAASDWVAVDDSQGVYWWNEQTNEVTAVGDPQPPPGPLQTQHEQPGFMSQGAGQQGGGGLGQVVKEGFAFGIGSSIARMAVGSMFGGGDDEGGGDDGWV